MSTTSTPATTATPATHKFAITLDEATGQVSAVHRCTVNIGGALISHSRDVEMSAEVAAAMKQFLDGNRAEVEKEALALAMSHIAATSGKKQPGVKRLTVHGALGPIGTNSAEAPS